MLHCRSSVSVLTGALSPSDLSHVLKSRFIPYLNATEQSASRPFDWSPLHGLQLRKLLLALVSVTLGMSAGSTTVAPCCFSTAIASSMIFFCASFNPPRGVVLPGAGGPLRS